jgi:hypothetical protein
MLVFLESFDAITTADMPKKGWTAGGNTIDSTHPRTGANGMFSNDNNKQSIKGFPLVVRERRSRDRRGVGVPAVARQQ